MQKKIKTKKTLIVMGTSLAMSFANASPSALIGGIGETLKIFVNGDESSIEDSMKFILESATKEVFDTKTGLNFDVPVDEVYSIEMIERCILSNTPIDILAANLKRVVIDRCLTDNDLVDEIDFASYASEIIEKVDSCIEHNEALRNIQQHLMINEMYDILKNSDNIKDNSIEKYLIQIKNILLNNETPKNKAKNDNSIYINMFKNILFWENDNGARLKDVYIVPKFRLTEFNDDVRNLYDFVSLFITNNDYRSYVEVDKSNVQTDDVFSLMIFGKPGSGKSSFVAYLASKLSDFHSENINMIRLRDLEEGQINCSNPLIGITEYMNIYMEELKDSTLILDGLDEICAMYKEYDFKNYLNILLEKCRKVNGLKIIITSRDGYFDFDRSLSKFCLRVDLANWGDCDIKKWSEEFIKFHHEKKEIILKNADYLICPLNMKMKNILGIPILFYMANVKGVLIEKHENISSIYDSVLTDVFEHRLHDPNLDNKLNSTISPQLARQIAKEIALMMFKSGKLLFSSKSDPFLIPDDVELAIENAITLCNSNKIILNAISKQKIHDMYALTFFYNKRNDKKNAVEFAHKTIAEYFIAEKILDLLLQIIKNKDMSDTEICEILSKVFLIKPITKDIEVFLRSKIDTIDEGIKESLISQLSTFQNLVSSGKLFANSSTMHVIDSSNIIFKSTLSLLNMLEYENYALNEKFCRVVANMSKVVYIDPVNEIRLPLILDKYNLSSGFYQDGNFAESSLKYTHLYYVNFTNADLLDADIRHSTISNADFTESNCVNTQFDNANISKTFFKSSNMTESSFIGTELKDIDFSNADLKLADFDGCIFHGNVNFTNATLFRVNLSNTDITRVNISDAKWDCPDEEMAADFEESHCIHNLKLTKEQNDILKNNNIVLLDSCII